MDAQATVLAETGYTYDAASRVRAVFSGDASAGYSYLANSPLVSQIGFTNSGAHRMTTSKSYDYLNRLTAIQSLNPQLSTLNSFSYSLQRASQRTAITNADGSRWVYQYDKLGQVTSGRKYWSDGTPVLGQQFEYSFDDIGNRKTAGMGGNAQGQNLRRQSYTANLRNQYTSRTVPGYVNIVGEATNTATVTVNDLPAERQGSYFRVELAGHQRRRPSLARGNEPGGAPGGDE